MVCLDESNKQQVKETRTPIAMEPGQPKRVDCEYERNGVSNLFMVFEPLAARRHVTVTDQRTAIDYAAQLKALVDIHYPNALKILVVQDQLNTHRAASLYKAFEPAEARRILDKLEFHFTPKHGSWLNMAEIELSVLARQFRSSHSRPTKSPTGSQCLATVEECSASHRRLAICNGGCLNKTEAALSIN